MRRLEERTAVITGAGSGIGKAIALRLAEEGASVVVADLKDTGDTVGEITKAGGKAVFVEVDVTDEEAVKNMVARTVGHFGRLDILINNAGLFSIEHCNIGELDTAIWHKILAVNLTGAFYCIKYSIPELLKSPYANIVNIASPSGLDYNPLAAYASSKAGLIALTRTTAVQYPGRIRSNAIVPGSTQTPQRAESRILRNMDPDAVRTVFPFQLVQREGGPSDVSSLIAFLVSDEASFIDASIIRADGGYIAPGPKLSDIEAMKKLREND